MVRLDHQELRYRAAGAVLSLPTTLSIFLLSSETRELSGTAVWDNFKSQLWLHKCPYILFLYYILCSYSVAANVFNLSCQLVLSLSQYTFTFIWPSGLISRPSNISVPTTLSFRLELYYSAFENKTDLSISLLYLLTIVLLTCVKSLFMISRLQFLSQLQSVCEVPHL